MRVHIFVRILQGWCNNIAWNVAPLSEAQYTQAANRYELCRMRGVRSIVPMVHLTLNLARSLHVSDARLHTAIRSYFG